MHASVLSCPVRGCGQPLASTPVSRGGVLACPAGHSYDIARSGYVNLLQPQDRRSLRAGDSKDAVEARIRLLESGAGRASLDNLVSRATGLGLSPGACVVDLGCGSGEALAMLHVLVPVTGVGIDLSTAAVDLAARRYPHVTWVVANADRRVPILDRRAALVLSLNGRRNPDEAARILAPGGHLLITMPGPDDLIELRELVQGTAVTRARGESVIGEHAPHVELVERAQLRERVALEPEQLLDLLHGTYRGRRASEAARVAALTRMTVTLSTELLVFVRR